MIKEKEVEVLCDDCTTEFTIIYSSTFGAPELCPWCGRSIELKEEEE